MFRSLHRMVRTHGVRAARFTAVAGATVAVVHFSGVLPCPLQLPSALCGFWAPRAPDPLPPQPCTPPTPVDPLLIKKAISAKEGCNGPATAASEALHNKPFIIGVTGGTASGKTTVCDEIERHLGTRVALLQMDRFYKTLPKDKPAADHNFDVPDAFDWPLFVDTLRKLSTGQTVRVPRYSFVTHARLAEEDVFPAADVIMVEGILTLHDQRVRDQFDLKVFVEADADVRLARRIQRDIVERGRKVDDIIAQYLRTVKPGHEQFIGPTIKQADLIVPWHNGPHNNIAIEMIVQHINTEVYKRRLDPKEQAAATAAAAAAQQTQDGAANTGKRKNL